MISPRLCAGDGHRRRVQQRRPARAAGRARPPAAWKSCIRPARTARRRPARARRRRAGRCRRGGTARRPGPAIAARWMTALVEPPTACSTPIALPNASRVTARPRAPGPCRTARPRTGPPARAAVRPPDPPPGSTPTRAPSARAPRPSRAIVDAVPMVLHAPGPQARHAPAPASRRRRAGPARRSSHSRHSAVPVPIRWPRKAAGSRAPPVTSTVGMSALIAPMSAPGTRLVAVGQQDDAVERVSADHLLDLDRQQVAVQHRGRLHQVLAERDGRRTRAGMPPAVLDAAADRAGQRAQRQVAGVQLAGRSWRCRSPAARRRPTVSPEERSATRWASATSSSPASQALLRRPLLM